MAAPSFLRSTWFGSITRFQWHWKTFRRPPLPHLLVFFEFVRMPFGLRNAAQTFQCFIDQVLRGLPFSFAYLDDIGGQPQCSRAPGAPTGSLRPSTRPWSADTPCPSAYSVLPHSTFSDSTLTSTAFARCRCQMHANMVMATLLVLH